MFESQDFISYFTEIEMLERNMHDIYGEAVESVSDPEIKKTFSILRDAEARHEVLVGELRRIAIKKSVHES